MTTCQWCVNAKKWQEDQEKLDEQATTMPSAEYVKKSDIIMGLYKFCNEKCKCESSSEEQSEGWRLDDLLEEIDVEIEVHEVEVTSMLATYYWNEESKDLYNSDGRIIGKTINEPSERLENGGFHKIFNYNDVEWF